MYSVKADTSKNILFMQMEGFMKEETLSQFASDVKKEVRLLESGFSVINDISKLKATTQNATEFVRSAHATLAENGVGKVVRVVGSSLTTMQF